MDYETQIFTLVDSCLQMDNQNEFMTVISKIEELLKSLNVEFLNNVQEKIITKLRESKIVNQVVTQIIEKVNTISYDMPRNDIEGFLNLKSLTSVYESSKLIDKALDIQLKVRLVKESPAKAYYGYLIKNWDLDYVVEDNLVSKEEIYQAVMDILPLELNDKLGISTNPFDEIRYIDDDQFNRYANDLIKIYLTKVDRKNFLKLLLDGKIQEVTKYLNIDSKEIIDKINELNFSENELFNVALSKYDLFKESNNFDFFDDEMLNFFQAKYPKFFDFLQRKTLDAFDFNMVTELDDRHLENLQRTGDFTMILNSLKKQGKTQEEIINFFRNIVENKYSQNNKLRRSPDFLKWCIDNQQYEWLRYFYNEDAFTESNLKILINTIENGSLDMAMIPIGMWKSSDFLDYCLKNQKYNFIGNFFEDAFTEEIFAILTAPNMSKLVSEYNMLFRLMGSPKFLTWCMQNGKAEVFDKFNLNVIANPENIQIITNFFSNNPHIVSETVFPNVLYNHPEILKWCIENKKFHMVSKFFTCAFNSQIDDIVTSSEIFNEISKYEFPSALCSSKKFLKACLENKKYDWINQFDSNAFKDQVSEVLNLIDFTEIAKYDFPYALKNSPEFLKSCLTNEKYDWLSRFNSTAFTPEIIQEVVTEKVFSKIVDFNIFIRGLEYSPKFLKACLENKKYDWINQFTISAFTDDNVKLLVKPEVFNAINNFPAGLRESPEFLKACIENQKFNWIYMFYKSAFTSENVEKITSSAIFSEIMKRNCPFGMREMPKFLEACLANEKYDWIKYCWLDAFDVSNIQKIVEQLGAKELLSLDIKGLDKQIYNLCISGKLQLNKFDFSIIEEINNCLEKNLSLSTIKIIKEILYNLYGTITEEDIRNIGIVVNALVLSNSEEIIRLKDVFIPILIKEEKPLETLKKIETIFLKKDLPYVAKMFIIFQQLHSEQSLKNDMIQYTDRVSPVLKNSDNSKIWSNHYAIIWSDLLKCALGSNNRSLKEFINQIDQGNQLYMLYSFGKIKFEDLNLEQKQILTGFVSQLNTLYNMSQKGREKPNKLNGNILEDLNKLVELIEPTEKKNLADKIIRMYGIFEGINSLEGAKEYLELYSKKADLRHRALIENGFKLEPGDFIKGIGSIRFLAPTLQNGAVAQEFLGYAAGRDTTPLDTDLARFTSDYGNFRDNISGSMAREYANADGFWVVLKNDDRFQYTRLNPKDVDYHKYELVEKNATNNVVKLNSMGEVEKTKFEKDKIEAFYTSGATANSTHYGIRTGFASSEIDFIISQPYGDLSYDPRICVEIAMNGFYIPVVDMDGQLVFTPRDYDELRGKMQGLSYYDANNYEFSNTLANQQINAIVANLNDLTSDTLDKNTKVNKYFEQIFNEMGYGFKPGFDGDITPGGVELINTGSTSRFTNANKEGDYDFILRVDKSIFSDSDKLKEFKNSLLDKLEYTKDVGGAQPRLKEVKIPGIDAPVDIDLTIVGKTNQLNYSTEKSLEDRLKTISKQDLEKYQYVLANIILAKQTLKAAKCYKPKHSGDNIPKEEKCGLGGVGIENWVLQNGGSFQQAAESFLAVAEGKNFEEFCKSYYVWDFGENHKAVEEGSYVHDNFIDNMTPSGYEKMKTALQQYLNKVKNVEQQVSVGIFDTFEEEQGRKF